MPTVIRRSGSNGARRVPRIPFPEPGPQPTSRFSTLSLDSVDYESVPLVPDVADGAMIGNGSGTAPLYRLEVDSGLPLFDFDNDISGSGNGPTFHRGDPGRPVVKSMIVIGRLLRLPTGGNAYITRAGYDSLGSLFISNATDPQGAGRLAARGTGAVTYGQTVEVGRVHFLAATFNGAGSILQYQGHQATATLETPATAVHLLGHSRAAGHRYQIVEAMQYDVALTAAQLEEKREHYRGVYQF